MEYIGVCPKHNIARVPDKDCFVCNCDKEIDTLRTELEQVKAERDNRRDGRDRWIDEAGRLERKIKRLREALNEITMLEDMPDEEDNQEQFYMARQIAKQALQQGGE